MKPLPFTWAVHVWSVAPNGTRKPATYWFPSVEARDRFLTNTKLNLRLPVLAHEEPNLTSLAEMPEVDLSKAKRRKRK